MQSSTFFQQKFFQEPKYQITRFAFGGLLCQGSQATNRVSYSKSLAADCKDSLREICPCTSIKSSRLFIWTVIYPLKPTTSQTGGSLALQNFLTFRYFVQVSKMPLYIEFGVVRAFLIEQVSSNLTSISQLFEAIRRAKHLLTINNIWATVWHLSVDFLILSKANEFLGFKQNKCALAQTPFEIWLSVLRKSGI